MKQNLKMQLLEQDGLITQLLNETQVARMMAVSLSSLQKWRLKGEGPRFIRIGRSVRYPRLAILEYLGSCNTGGAE